MADDWSQQEVEIIVEDYLGMLALELRGQDYNKAERNRELQKLLPARSRGSIEFKHANISAVMIEMGYPYVDGYKPRSNFQGLLQEVVERRVYARPELAMTVAKLIEQPVVKPTGIDDILSILVDPPAPEKKKEALSGINVPRLLVASHIKPWSKSTEVERLDPRNGLCLSSLHDAAFDAGLITLDGKLAVVLSKRLKSYYPQAALEQNFMPFEGRRVRGPQMIAEPAAEFLNYHRSVVFKD